MRFQRLAIFRGIQYRFFTLAKIAREVSCGYGEVFCCAISGRPSVLLGIAGFSGVLIGMNTRLLFGIPFILFFSVFCVSALLRIFSVRRERIISQSQVCEGSDHVESHFVYFHEMHIITLFLILLIYSFSFTAINKYRSEIFMKRGIGDGELICDRSYAGYVVESPLEASGEKASSYIMETADRVKISFFSSLPVIESGDYVEISGKLFAHRGPDNPGGFDYKAYYASRGIYLKLSASDSKINIRPELKRSPGLIRLAGQVFFGLREQIKAAWRNVVPEEETALLAAMILGDKSEMSEETKDRFRASNFSHLIAVSGLHVNCFLIPVLFCFGLTGKRKFRKIGVISALIFFGCLTGWTASVARAVIMSIYSAIASLIDRRVDALSGLFCSSVILLLINPYVLSDIGFQLSFGATLSIILLGRRLSGKIEKWMPRVLSTAVATMLSAQLGMLPVLVKMSAKQSPVLMVISIAGTVLSQGICTLGIPITAIYLAVSSMVPCRRFFGVMFLPVRGLIFLMGRLSGIGEIDFVNALRLESLAPLLLIGVFGLIPVIVMKRSVLRRFFAMINVAVIIAGISLQVYSYINRPLITVVFLDVGQGDSSLILTREKTIIIDGGEAGMCDRVLIPALDYYGVRKADVAIMSHLHSDHGGGLLELVEEGRVENIAVPFFGEGEEYDKLTQGLQIDDIFYVLDRNDRIEISGNVFMNILHPSLTTCDGGNEDSLVVMLMVHGTGILFMGDAGFVTEEELMQNAEIRSLLCDNTDIMKVGHHGSKYSTSAEFLSLLTLKAAVVSVGNNFYGHPTVETLSRLEDSGADVYRTDRDGAVILNIYEDHATIQTMQE